MDTNVQMPLFLTKAQMAAVLQVSIRCITAMMKRGELPYLKLSGGFVRFRLEDVNRRLTETALVGPSRTGVEGTKADGGCQIPDAGLGGGK